MTSPLCVLCMYFAAAVLMPSLEYSSFERPRSKSSTKASSVSMTYPWFGPDNGANSIWYAGGSKRFIIARKRSIDDDAALKCATTFKY